MFIDHGLPPPSYTAFNDPGKTKNFTECYLVVNKENLLLYNYKVSSLAIGFDDQGIFTIPQGNCRVEVKKRYFRANNIIIRQKVFVASSKLGATSSKNWVERCYHESKDNITKFNRTKPNLKLISNQIPNFGESIIQNLEIGDVIYLDNSNSTYKLLKPLHNGGKRRLKTKSKK